MNLVFFSMWYFPETVNKPHSLAKELKKLGHSVTVITGFPNYPHGVIYPEYKNAPLVMIEHIDGVRVIRVRYLIDRSTSAIRRIIAMVSFSLLSSITAVFSGERYDAVWTYQIGLPGSLFSFLVGIPHLHEVQDLWPAWSEGVIRDVGGLVARILTFFQRCIYLQASIISTISFGFLFVIASIYKISRSKIRVLPNWADATLFDKSLHVNHSRSEFGLGEGFLVTYGGNIGTAQGLGALIEAAALLSDRGCIIAIAGDGVERSSLESRTRRLNIKNVTFIDRLTSDKMGVLLSVSDVLFIGLARDKKYEITIPSKTYAYLSAGKPILAAASGDLADLICKNGIGITCSPEDPGQIASAILQLMNTSLVEREKIGERAYSMATTVYNGRNISLQYQELIASLLHV